MRFYNRKGILYVDNRKNGGKRHSTKLPYSEDSIKAYKTLALSGKNETSLFLNDFVKDIIEEKRLTIKETSILTYESVANSLIYSYFENCLICSIKARDIKKWQLSLISKGISSKSIIVARSLLNQSFNNAIIDDYIISNPLRAVKLISTKSKHIKDPFSYEEMKLIIDSAKGHFKNILAISFFTGLRTGELIGLKWNDIDLDNRTITIKRTINKGRVQAPKTESSKRTIDILDTCYPYIINQQRFTKLRSEFVFLSNKNVHYSSSYNLRYSFSKILEKANVRYRSIYNTRHTFASLMLSNGENLLWVSETLGHKSSDETLKSYSKYITKEKKKRASFLDDWHKVGS